MYGTRRKAKRARRRAKRSGLVVGDVYKSGDSYGFTGAGEGKEAAHYTFDKPARKPKEPDFLMGSKGNLNAGFGGFTLTDKNGTESKNLESFRSPNAIGKRDGYIIGSIAGASKPSNMKSGEIVSDFSKGLAHFFSELFGG